MVAGISEVTVETLIAFGRHSFIAGAPPAEIMCLAGGGEIGPLRDPGVLIAVGDEPGDGLKLREATLRPPDAPPKWGLRLLATSICAYRRGLLPCLFG